MQKRATTCLDGGEDCYEPYYQTDLLTRDGKLYGILIEMFVVPSSERGNGVGTRMYEAFERGLHPDIKVVGVVAADLGTGDTREFWKARGFVPAYDYATGSPAEVAGMFYAMLKGVNGAPNPDPLPLSEYDEPFFPAPPCVQQELAANDEARPRRLEGK